jgi:hypothetical protein
MQKPIPGGARRYDAAHASAGGFAPYNTNQLASGV